MKIHLGLMNIGADQLLMELYNHSKVSISAPYAIHSMLQCDIQCLNIYQCREILSKNPKIDYLYDRPIKVDFSKAEVDLRLYERDNPDAMRDVVFRLQFHQMCNEKTGLPWVLN